MTEDEDRILRSSVPEAHRAATSPIGAVQNYISELERALGKLGYDVDDEEYGNLIQSLDESE